MLCYNLRNSSNAWKILMKILLYFVKNVIFKRKQFTSYFIFAKCIGTVHVCVNIPYNEIFISTKNRKFSSRLK